MADWSEKYSKAVELAGTVESRVGKLLFSALERLGNPDLVKAVLDKPRIKSLGSVAQKATEKGWSVEEAIERCCDFLGFRLVCNNLQDVFRAADLFQRALDEAGIQSERHDYIAKPRRTGYRGLHITFRVRVAFGTDEMALGGEIQIRTRLQDAWSRLSREELYRKKVPEQLVKRTADLAEALSRADAVAEDIRREVSKPRKGEEPQPGGPLTAEAIAFIFHRAFGYAPPDYLVESAAEQIGERTIRADALDALLQDRDFRGRVTNAYLEHTKWEPWPERIFQWAVQAAVSGSKSAVVLARREGKRDWGEVDRQYKSEISYAVPETWAELKGELEAGAAELETIADYFDAKGSCSCCGGEIFHFESLTESIVTHYGLRSHEGEQASEVVSQALGRTDMDDAEGGSLCSHCWYVMNKYE
jgi:putative GTP pyrophosphokinase